MRIINPTVPASVTDADKADLQSALVALGAQRRITFADIRGALPAGKRARMTDGMIHQAALDLGLKVDIDYDA